MQTFKQFLLSEATKARSGNIEQKWKISKLGDMNKVVALLKSKCKNALKAAEIGDIIYRGFTKSPGKAVMIDSSDGFRTSRDTNNLYQLMHDTSEKTRHVPSRSNAVICSTSFETAKRYGGEKGAHIIFPEDGTQIAMCDDEDFHGAHCTFVMYSGSVTGLESAFYRVFKMLGFNRLHNFEDAGELNVKMATVSATMLTLMLLDAKDELTSIKLNEIAKPVGKNKINPDYGNNKSETLNSIMDYSYAFNCLRSIAASIDNGELKFTPEYQKIADLVKSWPKNARFTKLSSHIFNDTTHEVDLITVGGSLKTNRECWFSGTCIAVSISDNPAFIKALKAAGFEHAASTISNEIDEDSDDDDDDDNNDYDADWMPAGNTMLTRDQVFGKKKTGK